MRYLKPAIFVLAAILMLASALPIAKRKAASAAIASVARARIHKSSLIDAAYSMSAMAR